MQGCSARFAKAAGIADRFRSRIQLKSPSLKIDSACGSTYAQVSWHALAMESVSSPPLTRLQTKGTQGGEGEQLRTEGCATSCLLSEMLSEMPSQEENKQRSQIILTSRAASLWRPLELLLLLRAEQRAASSAAAPELEAAREAAHAWAAAANETLRVRGELEREADVSVLCGSTAFWTIHPH